MKHVNIYIYIYNNNNFLSIKLGIISLKTNLQYFFLFVVLLGFYHMVSGGALNYCDGCPS